MTGKDGVIWAMRYYKEKGFHLQPNEEDNLIVLWEQHVKGLEAAQEKESESKDEQSQPKKIESDVKTGRHRGFMTGSDQD